MFIKTFSKNIVHPREVMADPELQEALTESSSYEAPVPYLAEKAKAQLAEEVAELQEELERRLEEEVAAGRAGQGCAIFTPLVSLCRLSHPL